jgi:trans-2,3-dihydro-3-hydroxyanthranilate isomerase
MDKHAFYMLDVFAEEKYAGNQLAVVLDATDLSSEQMQKIANETHFSETTFILSGAERNGGFDVRIFTPAREVPFAGHPTLGTAYVIKRFLAPGKAEVVLNLQVGQIPVTFQQTLSGEILWMRQAAPTFGKIFQTERFAELLGLKLSDFDRKFPIQVVSTGLPFIMVPLKTLDAVKRARVNQSVQEKLAEETQAGVLVFCPETCSEANDLHVRVFVDAFGIPEDPATGSGNGCLAAYLSRYKYFGVSEVDAKVEQGYEIQRPSLLHLHAEEANGEILVKVGGKVVLVAKGELL